MDRIRNRCFLMFAVVAAAVGVLAAGQADRWVKVRTTADSEQVGYEAWRAMDGDPQTMWHTQFGSADPPCPHEFVVDLGQSRLVGGFSYLPRPGGGNGTIRDFELYVWDAGETPAIREGRMPSPQDARETEGANTGRMPVLRGRFSEGSGWNVVKLDKPVVGRYVKLRALSEVNGRPWTSIAELEIHTPGVKYRSADVFGLVLSRAGNEVELAYMTLQRDLASRGRIMQHAAQTYHPEALIAQGDRDPLDVILRRTAALLDDLQAMGAGDQGPGRNTQYAIRNMQGELGRLKAESEAVDVMEAEARFELFARAHGLQRRIAFANPLLDFDKILFIKRHRATFNHMCDQYYGINVLPGGGLYVLSDPFGDNPKVRDILADTVVQRGRLAGQTLTDGSFLSPDLSFDGKTILFAYVECKGDTSQRFHTDVSRGHWHEQRSYHIFKVNADGSGLEQLTDGTWNDFDPCWLPNGRVAFITERRGGYLRCGRECPTYTLFDMAADGGDIRCLSPHETNEWHPSVTNDGMIVYTRWDYVDRHGCTAHLPWVTTPDGRDARAMHGNFAPREVRADMELDVRAIPGSRRFVATGAPHHGQAFGSLVVVDPRIEDDDAMGPVRRLTPEVDFPETQGGAQVYGTAWPLSEKYFLCVYDPTMQPRAGEQGGGGGRGGYGIYLLDAFGNKVLIYRDPEIACQSPMPLRPRPVPPVMPEMSTRLTEGGAKTRDEGRATSREPQATTAEATMAVVNVYDTLRPWPEDLKAGALRVYQIIPMSVPSGDPPHEIGLREPTAGDSVVLARYVLGTVPIEADGSAHFVVPALKELFFQVLDEQGLAIQSMRSATYAQPGEQLVCQGCHEPRHRTPRPAALPLAMRREPSRPTPDVDGTNPFSYPRLVQPVLDRHCVGCHRENADKAPRLDGEPVIKGRQKWYASYHSLVRDYGFWSYGDRMRTLPGRFGARASKLYPMLRDGHHDVKLTDEEMHRITVWLDACSIFYGVYEAEGGAAQLAGQIVRPTLE